MIEKMIANKFDKLFAFILDILLSSIIIITQDSSQAPNTYKCL